MTARAQVKRRGISRQVINYAVEQRQSNQKWQTVFKRLFSSIKQAACLCQLWVWRKTIQLKRPRMFIRTHIHMQLQHGASCIVFCVTQPTLVLFFFFDFSTSVTKQPITNYTEAQTRSFFRFVGLPPVKRMVGHLRNQTNQSTSKVESEWMYWRTQEWGAVEVNKCEMLWDILLSLCFKSE